MTRAEREYDAEALARHVVLLGDALLALFDAVGPRYACNVCGAAAEEDEHRPGCRVAAAFERLDNEAETTGEEGR